MRRLIPILTALLLAAGLAHAQIGGAPGVTGPVTNPTFTGIIDATGGVFKGATPLCFEGATVNDFETCFAITDPAAIDKTITFPNLTGTVLLGGAANSFAAATTSITFTGAANATPLFSLEDDDTDQTFLSFTDVGTPTNVVAFKQTANTPQFQLVAQNAATDYATITASGPAGNPSIYVSAFTAAAQDTAHFVGLGEVRSYLNNPVNADFEWDLKDDDTDLVFLTFTDVGTATNVITGTHTVNTPVLTWKSASAANDATIDIEGDATPQIVFNVDAFDATFNGTGLYVGTAGATGDDRIVLDPGPDTGDAEFDGSITTQDLTAARTYTFPDETGVVALSAQFNYAVPDNSNGGTAATYTYQPTAGVSVATFDCLDANGCEVTVGETNAVPGQRLVIIQTAATAGTVTLMNSAGVCNLDAAANQALTVDGTVELVYFASTWQQVAIFYDGT